MSFKIDKLLDSIGKNILKELQNNARISFSELGRKVGLSTPAVSERVRKLEETGIIKGYYARVRHSEPAGSVTAFVQMTTGPEYYERIESLLKTMPQVLECHHVSGKESFIIKLIVPCVADLESIVARLGPLGQTKTSIVLSSPLVRQNVRTSQNL